MKILLSILILISIPCFGNSETLTKPPGDPVSPVLSAKGMKRIRENLKIISDNLYDSEKNLLATKKNVKVIEEELMDLDKLEKEHEELRVKYDDYLVKAAEETKRNDEAYQKIEAQLKKMGVDDPKPAAASSESEPSEREKLLREKSDREAWKSDAAAKAKKVQELKNKLITSEKDIQSRRDPLREQLKSWTARTQEYEGLVNLLTQKKAELEKLAKK
jgi:hypothetical protein